VTESRVIEFDASAYSLLAIQKACHRFTNKASFEVSPVVRDGASFVRVSLSLLAEKNESELTLLVQQLNNEVLDQQLREQVREQTAPVRNLILAYAFSRTGLIAPDGAPPAA